MLSSSQYHAALHRESETLINTWQQLAHKPSFTRETTCRPSGLNVCLFFLHFNLTCMNIVMLTLTMSITYDWKLLLDEPTVCLHNMLFNRYFFLINCLQLIDYGSCTVLGLLQCLCWGADNLLQSVAIVTAMLCLPLCRMSPYRSVAIAESQGRYWVSLWLPLTAASAVLHRLRAAHLNW